MNTSLDMSESQWAKMLAIEEETDCDVSAGFDYGQNTSAYLALGKKYIDSEKLLTLLHERLEPFLTTEDIEHIAEDLIKRTQNLVEARLQQSASALVPKAVAVKEHRE